MLKGLISRKELDEKVRPFEGLVVNDVVLGSQNNFSFDPKSGIRFRFGSKESLVTSEALGQLSSGIGMPASFASKLPAELLVPQLNYFYTDKLASKGLRLVSSSDRILAVSAKTNVDFIPLSNVLEQIEKSVGEQNVVGYHKVNISWDSVMISVVLNRTFEVIKEDFTNVGIRFNHSLLGVNPTTLSAYMFRQICSNGAIAMDEIAKFSRRGRIGAVVDWAREATGAAMAAIEREEAHLRLLSEKKTEKNTATILDSLLEKGGVPKSLRDEVKEAALNQQPKTLYDLYNVLTAISTHSAFFELHPSSRFTLEATAGMLSKKCHLCNSCHRPLP